MDLDLQSFLCAPHQELCNMLQQTNFDDSEGFKCQRCYFWIAQHNFYMQYKETDRDFSSQLRWSQGKNRTFHLRLRPNRNTPYTKIRSKKYPLIEEKAKALAWQQDSVSTKENERRLGCSQRSIQKLNRRENV